MSMRKRRRAMFAAALRRGQKPRYLVYFGGRLIGKASSWRRNFPDDKPSGIGTIQCTL